MDYTVFAVSPSGETIYSNASGDLFYLSDRGTYIPVRREEDIRKGLAVGSFDIVNKDEFDDAGNLSIGGYIVDPADCERVNPESSDVSSSVDDYASNNVATSSTEGTLTDDTSNETTALSEGENVESKSNLFTKAAVGPLGKAIYNKFNSDANSEDAEGKSNLFTKAAVGPLGKAIYNKFNPDANSEDAEGKSNLFTKVAVGPLGEALINNFNSDANSEDVGAYVTDNFSSALQPTPENNTTSDNTNQSSSNYSSNVENVSSNGGEWDFTADSEMQDKLSNELMESARNFDDKVDLIYKEIDNLSSSWVGEDYNAYCNATKGYKTALGDLSDSIRMYGRHFEKMADTTDELASELIEIVETCTYRHVG